MRTSKLFLTAIATCIALGAASASAQVLVGFQQRFFEKYGDGSTGPDSVPCCQVTGMNPVATIDARRTGGTGNVKGAYFAEFKNKTAMVGNLFGFGTPAALNGKGRPWYGKYNTGTGGVTLNRGRYTSRASLMLVFPNGNMSGGNLRKLTTMLERTVLDLVMKPNNGPGNFSYMGRSLMEPHTPPRPTFRTPGTYLGPYPSMAGRLIVTAGPNRFGGTRAVVHTQFSRGINVNTNADEGDKFDFPVQNGPGLPFTPMNVVRRETASAMYAKVTIADKFATTGAIIGSTMNGTGWFTILPYTTGTVMALANTIGTVNNDWTTRTDMGFRSLMVTGMGGITGTLQLVSGHLLQSRGGSNTNLSGTNMTRITFTPEPASAAMLGVGAIGLLGMVIRDVRRKKI